MSFASLREKKPLLGADVGNADSKEHSEEQKKAFLCGKLRQCLKNPKTKAFANHQLSLQAFPFFVHLPPTALASVAEIFQKFYKVGRFDGPLHAGWLEDRSPVCPCATVPVSSAASPPRSFLFPFPAQTSCVLPSQPKGLHVRHPEQFGRVSASTHRFSFSNQHGFQPRTATGTTAVENADYCFYHRPG